MKFLIVLCGLVVVAVCAPQQNPNEIQLVNYQNENDGLGNYNFLYEQSDGQRRQETGELKNVGGEEPVVVMTGSYSFVAPDGRTYNVQYTADENGYHPVVNAA